MADASMPSSSSSPAPALVNGVSRGGMAATVQRRVALGVMVLPALGFVVAIALALRVGITAFEIGLLVVSYALTMFGVTAGFHRHFAHRAFKTSRFMRVVLAALGSMTGQGPLLFWVASHRRHHAYSDGPGDPHSPNLHGDGFGGRLRGFWHAHMGWMLGDEVTSIDRFAHDLLRDRFAFRLHTAYLRWFFLGLVLPAVLGWLVLGGGLGAVRGFLWGGLVRVFLVNQAAWCVGSVCHVMGRRSFPTPDNSGNVAWVAWITFGEGLQNNHHAFPSSAMHALARLEPDVSGWTLLVLRKLGVVWDLKIPSPHVRAEARNRAYPNLDPKFQDIL